MSEPWSGTPGVSEMIKDGRSAVERVTGARERIAALDPEIRAWVVRDDRALTRAGELDGSSHRAALPLFGLPVGVKDIIDVAGLPTRCGSPITSAEPVASSAACVTRLEALGAVMMGKTVTTEFAYFQPGPTRNPWAPGHTPGGSSSGSAAAVAAGMVPLALGSQTAASLIRPAAYCGIAGLVLGNGTANLSGIVGLSPSLDSLGLLTRDVADLRHVFHAFTGTVPSEDVTDPRLLAWGGSDIAPLDAAMRAALDALPTILRDLRLTAFEGDDHIRTLAADHVTIMGREAARERVTELREHGDELSRPLFELLESGTRVTDDEYWQATYRRDRSRADVGADLADAFVIGPAATGPAPAGLEATGSPIMSRPWQALGFPTVAVPGLRTRSGLPIGLQMIGPPASEGRLLAAAEQVQRCLEAADPVG